MQSRVQAASLSLGECGEIVLIFAGALARQLRWAIRRREFWEEIGVYAQPIIIGGLVFSKGEI